MRKNNRGNDRQVTCIYSHMKKSELRYIHIRHCIRISIIETGRPVGGE